MTLTPVWVWVPSLEMDSSMVSPGSSQGKSFFPIATPPGVPVVTRSPGSRVNYWLRYHTRYGTPKIMSLLLLSWRTSPFTLSLRSRLS